MKLLIANVEYNSRPETIFNRKWCDFAPMSIKC